MENNDPNLKPQPTGGLKLMTVFIAVLALHVVVIGGFTVYHLLGSSSDSDLALDKNHKGTKMAADATLPGDMSATDTTSADKSPSPAPGTTAGETASATDNPVMGEASNPSNSTANPAPVASSGSLTPTPAPAPMMVTPPPVADDASSREANPTAQTPSGPVRSGPVINPPDSLAPPAPSESAAAATSTDGTSPVADGTSYTVKKGDSLARIAHRHHVPLAKLKLANSLPNDRLHIGQKLIIPNHTEKVAASTDTAAAVPAVTPQLSAMDSTTSGPIASDDTAPALPTHAMAKSSKLAHSHKLSGSGSRHLYTVVKGDTLTRIAHKFRTTATAIMAANNITNARNLSIGKKLRIPSGETRSAADSAPATEPAEPETRTTTHGQLANYQP